MPRNPLIDEILARLKDLRHRSGLTSDQVDERLILGPGWMARFEDAEIIPSIDLLLAILRVVGAQPEDLFHGLEAPQEPVEVERLLRADPDGNDLRVQFPYGDHDATYRLPGASVASFEAVIRVMRDALARLVALPDPDSPVAQAIKRDAVADSFIAAAHAWPDANPSDLWYFVIYRAYCDPFNHPARFARLNFEQSWRRTGGWALERVLERHYTPFLTQHGITVEIPDQARKQRLLQQLQGRVRERLELDKIDVFLVGPDDDCFGVVHVKASFAERRSDDVPMSQALVAAGYASPLWTMDCKAMPAALPLNDGELGPAAGRNGDPSRRSAKRKDIEDDAYFSACFSYNTRTEPTAEGFAARAKVHVCDFQNPDDKFSAWLLGEYERFRRRRA